MRKHLPRTGAIFLHNKLHLWKPHLSSPQPPSTRTAPVPGTEQARAISYGHTSLASTTEAVRQNSAWVYPLRQEIGRVIVGQKYLIDRLLSR